MNPSIAPPLEQLRDVLYVSPWFSNVGRSTAGALMEAAYDDCQPPQFFTHLVAVYESGHLPVGWEGSNEGGALLIY